MKRSRKGNWEDHQRSRSLPGSLWFLLTALSFVVLWLSLLGCVICLAMVVSGRRDPWANLCVGTVAMSLVAAAAALGLSMTRRCPLCQGTPLHSRPCRKHRLAESWPLLTRRATAVCKILTTLSFRCMYCGTPFRLFQKSSQYR